MQHIYLQPMFQNWRKDGDGSPLTYRLQAKKRTCLPPPPPPGKFATISGLKDQSKQRRIIDVCTLCAGALACNIHMYVTITNKKTKTKMKNLVTEKYI